MGSSPSVNRDAREIPIYNPGYDAALNQDSNRRVSDESIASNYGPRLALPSNLVTNTYTHEQLDALLRSNRVHGVTSDEVYAATEPVCRVNMCTLSL